MPKDKKPNIKIAIAVPTLGNIAADSYDNHMEFFFHLGKFQGQGYEFYLWTSPRLLISMAREEVATKAVEMDMDYLFFFDDDMLFHKDILFDLLKRNKDICAALAFQRLGNHHPVIYDYVHNEVVKQEGMPMYKLAWKNRVDYMERDEEVQECDAVGFGVVLLKVEVLKKLEKPYFMSQMAVGEDFFFCHRAKQAGFKVHVDTKAKTGHLGEPQLITEEVYKMFRRMKDESGNTDPNVLATPFTSKVR